MTSRFLLAFLVAAAACQDAHAVGTWSSALIRARVCLMAGGLLDMFSRHRTNLEPICLRDKACPVGSVMSRSSSCVLPAAYGYAREIAFTLHHPCDQCASDEGVELAGQLMMSLAGLLRIPLEEISVGVLIMNAQLRAAYPLEHFVLHREGEHPLISTSRSTPSTSRWDFFMAVRVHTSRLLETDSGLAVLLSSDPATLGRVMNFGQLHTFEA